MRSLNPLLRKPPLEGRNSATLKDTGASFLGEALPLESLQKNKSSLPGIPALLSGSLAVQAHRKQARVNARTTTLVLPSPWRRNQIDSSVMGVANGHTLTFYFSFLQCTIFLTFSLAYFSHLALLRVIWVTKKFGIRGRPYLAVHTTPKYLENTVKIFFGNIGRLLKYFETYH